MNNSAFQSYQNTRDGERDTRMPRSNFEIMEKIGVYKSIPNFLNTIPTDHPFHPLARTSIDDTHSR